MGFKIVTLKQNVSDVSGTFSNGRYILAVTAVTENCDVRHNRARTWNLALGAATIREGVLLARVDPSTQYSQQPAWRTLLAGKTAPLFLIADPRLLIALAVALAEGFKQDYAGGYADVEGFYRAGGGERD
jgi:hypothetical protein